MFELLAVSRVLPGDGRGGEGEDRQQNVCGGLPVAVSSIGTFRFVSFINAVMGVFLEVSWVLSVENKSQSLQFGGISQYL